MASEPRSSLKSPSPVRLQILGPPMRGIRVAQPLTDKSFQVIGAFFVLSLVIGMTRDLLFIRLDRMGDGLDFASLPITLHECLFFH